jgi:hypothetical protein
VKDKDNTNQLAGLGLHVYRDPVPSPLIHSPVSVPDPTLKTVDYQTKYDSYTRLYLCGWDNPDLPCGSK